MRSKSTLSSILFAAALALPAIAWAQTAPVRPMVITTPLASGHLQTVSFVPPAGSLSQARASRMIELAHQELAARGIDKPTAVQIAVTLLGGALPTADGDVQVRGLLPKAPGKTSRASRMQVYYNGPYV